MLIERGDLRELLRALIATVLLDFMVGFHMIIQIGYLGKRAPTFRLNAYKRTLTGMQTSVIVQIGYLP